MWRVLAAVALLGGVAGCRRGREDAAELARLRAEQAELRARVNALEAQLQRATATAPAATAPAPAQPAPPLPSVEAGSPTLTPSTASPPQPPSSPPPPGAASRTAGLAVEDLRGEPPSVRAHPSLPELGGVGSEPQAAALLEQLTKQLETIKSKQAEQEKLLDSLDTLR